MDHVLCFLILNQIACTSVNFFIKILYCLFIKIWSDLHIDLFWLALWLSVKLKNQDPVDVDLLILIFCSVPLCSLSADSEIALSPLSGVMFLHPAESSSPHILGVMSV